MKKLINFSICEFLINNKVKLLLLFVPSIIMIALGNYALLVTFLSVFSVIENSSFQIFGTFLTSNKNKSVFQIFIFIFAIFFVTLLFEWTTNGGRLDFDRLVNINYSENIDFRSVLAPLLLFFLTYKKIPVSTTFILLSGFATKHTVDSMLTKTATSYLVSFVFGYYIWYKLDKLLNGKISDFDNDKIKKWENIQIISNIGLIIFWIMSNNSNLVVSLPRTFNILYFLIYILFCAISVFYVVFSRGGKIQSIIDAKNGLDNPKTNSILNIAFSLIIFMFQYINTTPVATTWSFVGLLSGRELALSMKSNGVKRITLIKILRDLSVLIYGLLITFIYVLFIKLI